MSNVRYPEVSVRLVGEDGNAFAILGRVIDALRRAGCPEDQVVEYLHDAMSGDYRHLLETTIRYVSIEG